MAACTDPACTAASTTTLCYRPTSGGGTSIVLGTDTKPVIAHVLETGPGPRVAVCGNTTCAPYTGNNR